MSADYLSVDGGRLYYEVAGEGAPVVLIHAGFLDSRMWDAQFSSYAARFKVVRYDVRGFGKSDRPSEKFSDCKDLYSLLKHLGIGKACLIGVSNGGRIALDFTVEYPDMVTALILVGTGVKGYESEPEEEKIWDEFDLQMKPQEDAVKENRLEDAVRMDVDVWAAAQSPESRERILQIALDNKHIQEEPPGRLQVSPEPLAFKRLREIKVPTLLIAGDRDFLGMQLLSKRLHAIIAGSKLTVIEGADHIANMSRPREFDEAVLQFLGAH